MKSNNELYEIIDSTTELITLPYGLYYIYCKDINYYKEITVENNIDELLIIDNSFKENIIDNTDLNETVENNVFLEKDSVEVIPENPKTIDNMHINIFMFLYSSILIIIMNKFLLKESKI